MTEQYLVVYASESGSTAEVAAALARAMGPDMVVDVRHVADVAEIDAYRGVIVGSSIRRGRWLPEAVSFVERHAAALARRPVAYFTTCMTLVDDTFTNRQTVLNYLAPVLRLAPDVHPLGLGLFAGALHPRAGQIPAQLAQFGDFRDWEQIATWGAAIGREIRQHRSDVTIIGGAGMRVNDAAEMENTAFDLEELVLDGRDLSGLQLPAAYLEQTTLTGARLAAAELPDAMLGWAELQKADLRQVNLHNANLIGANFDQANLQGANLTHAVMNGAVLTGVNLTSATMIGVDLNWADLSGATLHGATLRGANLCWANLTDCDLGDADLDGILYNEQTQWPIGFAPPANAVTVSGLP